LLTGDTLICNLINRILIISLPIFLSLLLAHLAAIIARIAHWEMKYVTRALEKTNRDDVTSSILIPFD
jgi:hypothetical protein